MDLALRDSGAWTIRFAQALTVQGPQDPLCSWVLWGRWYKPLNEPINGGIFMAGMTLGSQRLIVLAMKKTGVLDNRTTKPTWFIVVYIVYIYIVYRCLYRIPIIQPLGNGMGYRYLSWLISWSTPIVCLVKKSFRLKPTWGWTLSLISLHIHYTMSMTPSYPRDTPIKSPSSVASIFLYISIHSLHSLHLLLVVWNIILYHYFTIWTNPGASLTSRKINIYIYVCMCICIYI